MEVSTSSELELPELWTPPLVMARLRRVATTFQRHPRLHAALCTDHLSRSDGRELSRLYFEAKRDELEYATRLASLIMRELAYSEESLERAFLRLIFLQPKGSFDKWAEELKRKDFKVCDEEGICVGKRRVSGTTLARLWNQEIGFSIAATFNLLDVPIEDDDLRQVRLPAGTLKRNSADPNVRRRQLLNPEVLTGRRIVSRSAFLQEAAEQAEAYERWAATPEGQEALRQRKEKERLDDVRFKAWMGRQRRKDPSFWGTFPLSGRRPN